MISGDPQPGALSKDSSTRRSQSGILSQESADKSSQPRILSQESSAGSLQPISSGSALESFRFVPQTEVAMSGSNGVAKGALRDRRGHSEFNSHQRKTLLGDTCSRLAYAKQQVASSNINIYNWSRWCDSMQYGCLGCERLGPCDVLKSLARLRSIYDHTCQKHVIPVLSNLSGADLLLMKVLMRKTLARCEALSHGVVYDWLAMITLAFWLQRPRVLRRTVMLYLQVHVMVTYWLITFV